MDDKELEARIKAANEKFLGDDEETPEPPIGPSGMQGDLYEKRRSDRKEMANKRKLNGSSPRLAVDVRAVVERLAPLHEKARDDSEVMKERRDKARAEIRQSQYIEEDFLPAIMSLTMMHSPEDVLNNKAVLRELDKYATLDNRSGSGFTASFIRSLGDDAAYNEAVANTVPPSDAMVAEAIINIKRLSNNDDIRNAVALAKDTKKKIDSGKNIASDEDYSFIERVIFRSNNAPKFR